MEEDKKVRLSIEMTESEHKYLKLCCAKLGVSIKEFVVSATIDKVDLCEDEWMLQRWQKDGTREEIESEKNDKNRVVYSHEIVDGEVFFKPIKYCDFVEQRQLELAHGV